MQQDGGFLDNRTSRPIGLGIVIAAHAAVLTAIALAPPDAIKQIIYVRTGLINVAPDPTPPPPLPATRQVVRDTPSTVAPIVDTDLPITQTINLQPVTPTIDVGPVKTITPPKADPVFAPATIDPRMQARFQPDYPLRLIRVGVEGFATVRILIGTDGTVQKVELVNATDPAFFDATRTQALRFWHFKPATSDGTPTESWRTMTVRFKLQS